MAIVEMFNVPTLSTDYSNVMTFSNDINKHKYFMDNHFIYFDTVNIKPHSLLDSVTINLPMDNFLDRVDYVIIDEKYYFFVLDKVYINTHNTQLLLKLDVWNTYQNDLEYLNVMVERCHQNREEENLVYEDLPLGQYEMDKRTQINNFNTNSLLIMSASPLGVISDFEPPPYIPGLTPEPTLNRVPVYEVGMKCQTFIYNPTPGTGSLHLFGDYVIQTNTSNFTSGGVYNKEILIKYRGKVIHTEQIPPNYTHEFLEGSLVKSDEGSKVLYLLHRGTTQQDNLIHIYT